MDYILDRHARSLVARIPTLGTQQNWPEAEVGPHIDRIAVFDTDAVREYEQDLLAMKTEAQAPGVDEQTRIAGIAYEHATVGAGLPWGVPDLFGVGARIPYLVDHLNGSFVNEVHCFAAVVPVQTSVDVAQYSRRMQAWGEAIRGEVRWLNDARRGGHAPPAAILRRVSASLENLLAMDPDTVPAVAGAVERAPDYLKMITRAMGRQAFIEAVRPVLGELLEVVKTCGSAEWFGCSGLVDGGDVYDVSARNVGGTTMSPMEIAQFGDHEVARIRSEIRSTLATLGYPGDLSAALGAMRADPESVYPNSAEGRVQLLAHVRSIVARANEAAESLFGRFPVAPVVVKPIPEAMEVDSPPALYYPPTADGSGPGTYYINLRDPGALLRGQLDTLTYHEAVPGHHMQLALQLEFGDKHRLMSVFPFNAYVEGWALYAEQLMHESGAYAGYPEGYLGMLLDELLRAGRLVVDTGIHRFGWSRQRAVEYMHNTVLLPIGEAEAEVDRYAVWPAQALGYTLGKQAIVDLRGEMKRSLGNAFEIKNFHDAVLAHGSGPIESLRAYVPRALGVASHATGRKM